MAYEYQVTNKRYHTLDYYLKTKYGKKVFKIPLNASFSCPNRDGTKGIGGCTFCSNKGSGDFAGNPLHSLNQQYDEMIKVMERKWPDAYYIVYFQAYTNTYGSLKKLKETYEPFIGKEKVIGMSIATRPDCITEDIAELLKSYTKKYYVCVELGLQTSNEETGKFINRCYTNDDFSKAVTILNKYGIDIVTHIMIGLPTEDGKNIETFSDIKNTVDFLNRHNIQGLKIHSCYIVKNTKLEKLYNDGKYVPITL